MNVVVFEIGPWERVAFERRLPQHEITLMETPLRAPEAKTWSEAEVLSTFIYSDLSARVLANFPRLKLITTRSAGFDHIDLAYCQSQGITVCNVPSYGEATVAEHVFALLLALSHHIVEAVDRTRKGDFSLRGLQGFDLGGKTLGVVGTGHIGRHVIEIAKGFRMAVMAYDPQPDSEFATRLGFRYAPLEEVLAAADVLTLHVPATPATHHLLSSKQFALMKEGVVLINTARGSMVDVEALARALSSGKVAAAGLDVLPEEPVIREEAERLCSIFCEQHELKTLVADHILLRLPNVIVTPHCAFNTREAVQRIVDITLNNIEAFAKGRPQHVVATGSS